MNRNKDISSDQEVKKWIEKLGLEPHPEGGYFRETYSSPGITFSKPDQNRHGNERPLTTSIYFLLQAGQVSKLHSLRSDEIWCFHYGESLRLIMIHPDGRLEKKVLGNNIQNDEQLQIVVPAGMIFGAELITQSGFAVVGCVVSPGFHFDDFELFDKEYLLKQFPQHKDYIIRLT